MPNASGVLFDSVAVNGGAPSGWALAEANAPNAAAIRKIAAAQPFMMSPRFRSVFGIAASPAVRGLIVARSGSPWELPAFEMGSRIPLVWISIDRWPYEVIAATRPRSQKIIFFRGHPRDINARKPDASRKESRCP